MPVLPPPNVQEMLSKVFSNHTQTFSVAFICTSVLNCIFTVIAVVGNLLVLTAILTKLSIREPTYALLACLALADLGIGLICHPLYVVWKVDWLINGMSETYYQLRFFLSLISTYFASVSFLTVTAVSCERYLALHYHLRYKSMVTTKKLLTVVLFLWLFPAILSIFNYFSVKVNFYAQGLLIPFCLLTTAVAYIHIFLILRRHHHQIQCQVQAMSHHTHDQHPTGQSQLAQAFNFHSFQKSVTNMFLIYVLLLACYLPHFFVKIFYEGEYYLEVGIVRNFTMFGVYLNSSLNPIICCCRLSAVREAVKKILRFKNASPNQNLEH